MSIAHCDRCWPSASSARSRARRGRRCSIGGGMKGLIAAGGKATRLEELTRVTNKHLLPVGRWPMIYYPLQLLQRVGVREVLLVTGQQHAGQFIDLLGNGHVVARGGDEGLFALDVFDLITGLEPSSRGELEITDVNRAYAQSGRLQVRRVEGWWHDGGKHWADLAEVGRVIEETGANK